MNSMIYSWSKPEPFFIEFGGGYLHGDLLPGDTDKLPEILFLHGTEGESRRDFLLLRQTLLEQHGISSCAFDFMGRGNTGGKPAAESLQERAAQAGDIIDACFDLQPLGIVAVGTSAEVALLLIKAFSIRHLVLLNPNPAGDYQPVDGIIRQIMEIPAEHGQTLASLNNDPALLAKVAELIKETVRGG
jgi:pimeloyl-ACP methyl ester carboxylesterase